MSASFKRLSASFIAIILVGCATKESTKQVKQEPAKVIEGTFKASSLSQAKNKLMTACSNNRLFIKTDAGVVTCETKTLTGTRDRELELVVNDAYATDIREVFEFELTEQGADILVKANSFARYKAPVSVLEANQVRKRNLIDDVATEFLKKLLNQAGAAY